MLRSAKLAGEICMHTNPKDKFKQEKPEMLEVYAQDYWLVQKMWQGKIKSTLSVSEAMEKLNQILFHTNPARKLAQRAAMLLDEIILNAEGPEDEE